MAGTIRTTHKPARIPHLNLNSDGRPHPLLNVASFVTLILGLISFALGLWLRNSSSGSHGWAIATAATGLVSFVGGLFVQMMSATREERIIIVTGIIAGFVGLCLGLAHGGFS